MKHLLYIALIIILLVALGLVSTLYVQQGAQYKMNKMVHGLVGFDDNEWSLDPEINVVTAYSNDPGSINVPEYRDGLTATLTPARRGVCAAAPSVLPYGTKLYIEGYGECVVEDTGGAMRQAARRGIVHVDVFYETKAEAMRFGRREG